MFKLFFSLIFILSVSTTKSQIRGNCHSTGGKPIRFVNIVSKGKNYGTVTDEKGNFIINNENIKDGDTLIFSHVRFNPKEVILDGSDLSILLTEKHIELEEIIITNTPYRIKEVGTTKKRDKVVLQSFSNNLGNEVGKLIRVKEGKDYEVLKCFFKISTMEFKEAKLRINFYEIGEDHVFEKSPVNQVELIQTINQTGTVEVDLEHLHLSFNKDFIVALEWISYTLNEDSVKAPILEFASNVYNGPFYYRKNINQAWRSYKQKFDTGLGISVLVKSYKSQNKLKEINQSLK